MANNSAQYDVRLAFSADVAQARQQLKSLQDELSKLSTLKDVNVGTRLTKELEQASLKAADLKVMLEKATDINTGKLNLTSFSNQLTKNGESLSTYRKALSALGPQGEEAFLQLTQSVITADAALTTGSKKLNELKKTLANTVRWQISSSMMHSFIGGIETAYNYAKDLDRALTDIKIVTEDSTGAMANFAERANKAAQALSTTTKDYAQASLIYYQQGLNDKEVEARTAVTIKMANAAGESASKVSDQLTAVWNNFYDGSKSLEYYADVMTKLGAYTASSTDEISEGIQKFASVANTIGLSYEYATSALATLTAKTRESANTVGNSLKTLFARIQGLTLGETLEDGTDLNKYSKALEKVGISIKDQQGELKDMNTILDEMMNKWDSLSRAEKVALAQTVGGVRQYTQLVNLMENKDYFKELVGVAENSEGTLQLQADIYAKSWEGARKRVQAAAEGIYDSLIDEEFFKDVDNVVTVVLNGINATIKGLGGVKGVISNISALILGIYKKDITSGLNNFGTMIQNMTPKGRQIIEGRRQQALNEQQKLFQDIYSNTQDPSSPINIDDQARADNYKNIYILSQDIYNSAKNLTEEQKKQASQYVDILNAMGQRKILAGEILQKAKEETDVQRVKFQNAIRNSEIGRQNPGQAQADINIQNTLFARRNVALEHDKEISQIPLFTEETIKDSQLVLNTFEKIIQLNTEADIKDGSILNPKGNTASEYYKANTEALQSYLSTIKSGKQDLKWVNGKLDWAKGLSKKRLYYSIDDINSEEGKKKDLANKVGFDTQYKERLQNLSQSYNLDPSYLNNVMNSMDALTQAQVNFEMENGNVSKAMDLFREQVQKMAQPIPTTADAIVALGSSIASLASFSNQVQGLFDVWSNPDTSGLEKIVSTLSAIGIILPNLINLNNAINTIQAVRTANKAKEVVATAAETVATNINTEAEKENAKAKAAAALASQGKAAAEGAEAVAEGTSAVAKGAAGAATGLSGLISAFNPLTAAILGVVVAITAVVAIQKQLKKERAEAAEAARNQTEELQQEYEANEKLVQSYEDALNIYQKTGEGKSDLISIGQQLIDVYDIENGTLLLLTGQYEKLAEAAREAAKAEAERLNIQAGITYDAQTDTNKDEIVGLNGNSESGYRYGVSTNSNGISMRQEYLKQNPNDEWWISDTYDTREKAVNPENFVKYYDQVVQGLADFEVWAKDAGYKAEQISEATKDARQFLADNKTIYETNKNVNDTYRNSQLEVGYLSQDFSKISSVSDFAEKQKNIANSTGFTIEEVNAYLAQKTGLSDYAMLDNAVRQFAEASGWNVDELYSQLNEEQLKAVINLTPEIASHDIDGLIKQIEDYNKIHPVDISLSLKNAKKDLKDEMSDKDWKTFWEDTTDITWGSNGIVNQQTFQNMLPEQRTAYLNKLSQENYTKFTPEAIQNRYQDQKAIYENNIQNLQQNKKDEIDKLYNPRNDANIDAAYNTYEDYLNKLEEIKDVSPEFYESAMSQIKGAQNGLISFGQAADNIVNIRSGYNDILGDKFTRQDALNLGKFSKEDYDAIKKYNEDRLAIETKYDELTKEEQEKLKESQRQAAQDIRDYWTQSSNTITQLSKSDLNIGDIIQPEQYDILKTLGVDMDKYFIQMEDGTYKLITAAEEFNRTLGELSIEHAYDDVDTLLEGIYGAANPGNNEIRRQAQLEKANRYLGYSQEQLENIGTNAKRNYIESMGLNPDDYTDNLEQGVLDAAQKFVDYINNAEYRIDATVNNSGSMAEFDQNAEKASEQDSEWAKDGKKYRAGLINYQANHGDGIGRQEAIDLKQAEEDKQQAEDNLANQAPTDADIEAARQKKEAAAENAIENGQGNKDQELIQANKEYNNLLEKRKQAEEDVKKADENLAKSTDALNKRMRQKDFAEAAKDIQGFVKTLKTAKEGSDEYEKAISDTAESMEKAFGKTVTNEFVKNNKKLIETMVNPNATLEQRQSATNTLNFKLQIDQETSKQEITNALQEMNAEINAEEYLTALNNITLDAEGHIKITGDNSSAITALGGVLQALSSMSNDASKVGSLLNSILGTDIELDSEGLKVLKELADALASGDPEKIAGLSEEAQNLQMKIFGSGDAPNQPRDMATAPGGGGGSKSKKSAADIGKEIQDEKLKTYSKKRELLEAKRDGANPEDSAKYIQEEIKLLEEEQDILEDQIKSWKKLLKLKVEEFNKKHPEFEIKLTDDGEIANASELWGKVWAQYQKNLEDGMSEEDLNEWFTKLKDSLDGPMGIQQNIDENVALIAQKEKEAAELELEAITKQIDWKVKQIDFQIKRLNYYQEKLLKQAHGNKQTIEAMLEGFAYQEQEMLQLFDKGATLRDGIDQLNAAKAKYPGYEQMFDEQILEYQSDLIDVNEAILDLRNDIEDLVQNVLDLALDEIDKQIERLDTYTSMLDHLNNIIDLSGRSMLDMGLKTQIGATKVETMLGKMKSLKGQMDGLTKATKEAQAALADRQADGDTSSVKFWENQVEVLKQETEKASDEFLASWEETLEAAQDLFEMRVEMAVNILSNALSPFETLEDFQDKYEKAKTINEEYLDDAERLYELNKLNRQLNLQLADANDLLAKQKLRDIQQEIHDLQADGVKMSQYDLEYLQKKYDLQLAEIALMEQQNSKTSMRLVRDAAGNWTYAYDADEEKIEDATQKYEDAVHELGQLSKDYINDVSEQLIQNQIDFKEALQDLDKNSADYSNQLLSLQEYYVERQRYLLDELNKGVVNSGLTFHDTLYGQMTDLYDYNDAYMQFVNNSNTTITELQTNYKDWQKVVETAMGVAGTSWDNFGTDMGGTLDSLEEHIQKLCDEIEELVNVLMGYISQSIGMVLDWEQKYSKRTDEELAKNEAYIDGNFVGGGGGGGYGDVDMQTDFTALLQRWDAGERNLTNYNGTKTYNSAEEIINDLNKKLDAFEAGADILYQGSGESFKDADNQDVIDKYGLRRNGGNYTTYNTNSGNTSSIVSNASKYMGTPYVYGGTSSSGLDCSGLVYKALTEAGIDVPRTTAQGYKDMADKISESNVKPGDLVFFGANGLVDHVGIYMGNGQMINATGTKTQITDINKKRAGLIGYGRIGNDLSSASNVIDKYGLKRNHGAASGAYTGDWGPGQGIGIDNGKIIKVHPKELILNKSDTRNILRAVDIVRNMNDWVDKQVQQMSSISSSKLDSLFNSAIPRYETQPIKQEVIIQADFPGVTDHYEIEEALSNLSNNAAQYISANRSK